MATTTVQQLPKSTAELTITIPWADVKDHYQEVLASVSKNAEVEGFRKGKAPKKLVEEKINRTKLYEEVVRKIVPKEYSEAIAKHALKPIMSPQIEVLSAKEGADWKLKATVALKPEVKLGDYRQKVKALKASKTKIWTPGTKEEDKKDVKPTLEELLSTVSEAVTIELSDILVTQEANRLLADLLDQTKKLGLTVEQYIMAKGKTTESLRAEYAEQARRNLVIEFALNAIADEAKITVSKEDIENILAKIEKPEEREKLSQDTYYLAHLIRQQKTLDFLATL
jgi:FKBP-type peptidyl-prolyl cis-trans isomerase (trigger factor)